MIKVGSSKLYTRNIGKFIHDEVRFLVRIGFEMFDRKGSEGEWNEGGPQHRPLPQPGENLVAGRSLKSSPAENGGVSLLQLRA